MTLVLYIVDGAIPQASNGEDGTLPCFTSSGPQKLWSTTRARWLLAKEKFFLMGFPVTDTVAAAYGCGKLDPANIFTNPHFLVGNSMHVGNAAAVILATLLSVDLFFCCILKYCMPCDPRCALSSVNLL